MSSPILPNVFIIESLNLKNEKDGFFEGEILSRILNLSRKETQYYYIRTKRELKSILEVFKESKYRYLHLSCHGNKRCITTTLDRIYHKEFSEIVNPYLKDRRLSLSACSAVNLHMVKYIIPKSGCYSVIGFRNPVGYGNAAMVWSSFYHLMFKQNPTAMKRVPIKNVLYKISDVFKEEFNYFSPGRKLDIHCEIIRPK